MGNSVTVVSRLLVTVVVGGAVYLITSAISDSDDLWQITLALLAAGVILIIQYLVDWDQRLDRLDERLAMDRRETRDLVESSFSQINQATELFSLANSSSLRDEVSELVRGAADANSTGPAIVGAFVQQEIGKLVSLLDGTNRKVIDREGEDHDWIVELTRCAVSSIHGISTSIDRDFWSSETGRRYLREQREAIQARGVEIRRLFLVAEQSDVSDELLRQRENQLSLGIDVRVLVLESVSDSVRLGATNDFVVFDEQLSYEVAFDIEGTNATTTLNFQTDRVRQRSRRFNELWEAASIP